MKWEIASWTPLPRLSIESSSRTRGASENNPSMLRVAFQSKLLALEVATLETGFKKPYHVYKMSNSPQVKTTGNSMSGQSFSSCKAVGNEVGRRALADGLEMGGDGGESGIGLA